MLTFVKDVVTGFDVGANATRISVIRFESSPSILFDLDEYLIKADILLAVTNITYTVRIC